MALPLLSLPVMRYLPLLLVLVFVGCRQVDNLTARYNAYFLANERLEEVKLQLLELHPDNYNQVLNVLPLLDSNRAQPVKADLEYIIEKASLPVQWHSTSEWTDDCYLLIGQARMYLGDYVNAITTFKYVFANAADVNAQHEALIHLLRLFTETGEEENYRLVKSTINEQTAPYSEANTYRYHSTMAHRYVLLRDYESAAGHLEMALPLVQGRALRARQNYVLGQLYLLLNRDSEAYALFDDARRLSATYELAFQAELQQRKVSPGDIDPEKVREKYERAFNDPNNWETRDKVLYEQALYELRLGDTDRSLALLNESVQLGEEQSEQRGFGYLLQGQLYFDSLSNYPRAAAYYDSALQVLPENALRPDERTQAEYLLELAQHLAGAAAMRELLQLADMNAEEAEAFLAEKAEAAAAEALKREEFARLNQLKRRQPPAATANKRLVGTNGWYFYNTEALAQGQVAFLREWGNRPLEDHWRRQSRIKEYTSTNLPKSEPEVFTPIPERPEERVAPAEDSLAAATPPTDALAAIPATDNELAAVTDSLQEAEYRAGKLFLFKINRPQEAYTLFSKVLAEFPQGKHSPEIAYLLHDYCTSAANCSAETYKSFLAEQHPNSVYYKLLTNPAKLQEEKQDSEEANALYATAFEAYKQTDYERALRLTEQIESRYLGSTIADKVDMLQILIEGKTALYIANYYQLLNDFVKAYPESGLLPLAEQLLGDISQADLERRYIPGRTPDVQNPNKR